MQDVLGPSQGCFFTALSRREATAATTMPIVAVVDDVVVAVDFLYQLLYQLNDHPRRWLR